MLVRATLRTYVNGDYKRHRKEILFQYEQSRLPETMPALQNYLKAAKLSELVETLRNRERELRADLVKVRDTIWRSKIDLDRAKAGLPFGDHQIKGPRQVFKQACPAEGCRGFLSTAWKCGICASKVCAKCFALKSTGGAADVGNNEHGCNPDDVKTADLIRKRTKNCPSCAVPIMKVSGCDQMWCTQCHTAFSWKTGRQINGHIHNPHFYQWQQEGGGAPLQPPGAVPCGGLPRVWEFQSALSNCLRGLSLTPSQRNSYLKMVTSFHRYTRHFQNVELESVREKVNRLGDNKDLRIRYLAREIDEPAFRKRIMSRDKSREKTLVILQVYELANTVFTESIRDIWVAANDGGASAAEVVPEDLPQTIRRNLTRCKKLVAYANKELMKISILYSQVVGIIGDNLATSPMKFRSGGADIEDAQIAAAVAAERAVLS